MTELHYGGGEPGRLRAPRFAGRVRRYTLLLAVTLLCGFAYLVGIWTGMKTSVTCATVAPGQIVCGTDGIPASPAPQPTAPAPERGSA